MNTKVIKFDLNQYKLYEKIKAKQGDTKSRFLLFQLLDGAVPFDLTNRSVRAYMIKPDSKEVFNDLIVNNRNTGICTLELTNQVLAAAGIVKIELMITEEDKKLTSSIFELEVNKSINSEKSIVSTNEFTALLNGLASLSEYDNYKNNVKEMKVNKADKIYVDEENKKIRSDLDTIVDEMITIVTPQMYGAKGDGINDDTLSLQLAINDCILNNKKLSSSKDKTYLITSDISVLGNLDVDFNKAKILVGSSNVESVLKFNHTSNRQCEVTNILIDCNKYLCKAIHIIDLRHKFFVNIQISNCIGYGFYIENGYEVFVDKTVIYAPVDLYNDAYGIYITTHDCHFTDIIMRDVKNGVYTKGSNFFTRVHPWIMSEEVLKGSKCFIIKDTTFCTDCYYDTYETTFEIDGNKGLSLVGCKTYFNPSYYNSDTMPDNKPILFKYLNGSSSDGIKAFGCSFRGCDGCYSDGSLGEFSENTVVPFESIRGCNIYAWNNSPCDKTITTGTVTLESNFDSKYNRTIKDRNGDFVTLELQVRYNGGTINANTDTKICTIPTDFRPRNAQQILCSVSSSQWNVEDVGYCYISNDSIAIKLKEYKTNPYISINVTYRCY